MMMMMINLNRTVKIFLIALICFAFLPAIHGQETDFQTRWEAEFRKQFKKNTQVALSLEQHFKENSLQYDRSIVTLIGKYDLPRGFDVRLGARYLLVKNRELQLENRYRLHVDVNYKKSIGQFAAGLRLRTQTGLDDQVFRTDLMNNKLVSRLRLKGEYKIFGTRFTPDAGIEPYLHLNYRDGPQFYRLRNFVGCSYQINLISSIEASYLFDYELNDPTPANASIIWVTYKYQF